VRAMHRTTAPRTPAQRVAIGLGVLIVLAFIGGGAVSVASGIVIQSKDTTHTFVGAVSSVHVDVDGDITVQTGAAGPVTVTAHRVWSFQEPTITETRTGSSLSISAACHGVDWGSCSTSVRLVVPVSATLTLTSSDGNVSVEAQTGVLNAPGGTSIPESGSLNLTSNNGDVSGIGLTAEQVQASSDNGNVTLNFAAPPVTVNASSDNGDVDVFLPRGPASYSVSATTDNGNHEVRVPVSSSSHRHVVATSDDGNVSVVSAPG
jgi:Putative adhesin